MKLTTYNVMEGGVKPKPTRLETVLRAISEQDADVIGLQETKVAQGQENELVWAMRNAHTHPYDVVFDRNEEWAYGTGAALFSRRAPSSSRIIGERVRAVEMTFPILAGNLSVCNTYLSHLSEDERLPQVKEMVQELSGNDFSIVMGDFNAISPENSIPAGAVNRFTDRMMEKYCRGGKLCYDTIETMLEAGYIDIGLEYHNPEEITDKTDLSGGGGTHSLPIRMDYFFAKKEVLPYVREFSLVREGLARTASDHFPWHIVLEEVLFQDKA